MISFLNRFTIVGILKECLIDLFPSHIKARFNIDYPYVKPYYIDKAHLEYGITEAIYENYILKIFDRDRLICECIKHENKMDREIYNKAVQAYINDSKKNITNLLDYAKRRNIHKKVRERIGVWL